MALVKSLEEVRGVGPRMVEHLQTLGLSTVSDLIDYYPRHYEDYSQVTPIQNLRPGHVTIEATIKQVSGRYVRRGMHITEAIASDESGSVRLVWFNQAYRASGLKQNQTYFVSGRYELRRQRFAIMNPSVERASDFPVNTARLLPVYKENKHVSSRQLRTLVQEILPIIDHLGETLPAWVVKDHELLPRSRALHAIHAPRSSHELDQAKRRLGFEEIFTLGLASLINKRANDSEQALAIPFNVELARSFVKSLPFRLTDAQRKVVWRICQDMEHIRPMNRLVEGDVGSGKTAVAAMASVMVLAKGKRVALMAPTELLARQHAKTMRDFISPLGFGERILLLTGGMRFKEKQRAAAAIASGQAGFLIGTHALIQDKIDMHDLALIIIDEQQRFGVRQRARLLAKAGHMPHVLSLSATPIPRSLALTIYGEMDLSILDEKPVGRLAVITKLVSPTERIRLYKEIDGQLAAGRQMFVVCPHISGIEEDSRAAEVVYERLTKDFPHRKVDLLHGRMKTDEKTTVMERFISHESDVLVSTTVIEVGVDVPNATIMMIEGAEHFGLAQLHQLRGRVGRGIDQGYCYLLLEGNEPPSRRLRALETMNDGFQLAELDLNLRGPGAVYGTAQHGALDLRLVPLTDSKLISEARDAAEKFLEKDESLLHYKHLKVVVDRLRTITNLN
jgi:ATP-dependent DNA helicase RecG